MSHKLLKLLSVLIVTNGTVACSGSDTPEAAGSTSSANSTVISTGGNSNTGPAPLPTLSGNIEEGLIGPLGGSGLSGEYAQFNDSPFSNLDFASGYFYFEDFEDGILQHPGASASNGDFVTPEFGEGFHDSVDADDGSIDGNSLEGESWFYAVSSTGVTWTFDKNQLNGQLPTHVGIVWTDGIREITFEAFGESGQSLGSVVADHAIPSFNGETAEDRFYGVVHYAGVSSIKLSNNYRLTGIELDHLQWGYMPEEFR